MTILSTFLPILALLCLARGATKDDWRSRSIYQVMTDRFAPPFDGAPCNTADRLYCGGTWRTLISRLDYIQNMGFDAVWISPTALNLEGDTIDGTAYHGYWTADPTQLNPHFGTSDDLKSLSSALHSRGMYLMVDLALNALASTSSSLSAATLSSDDNGSLLFKDPSQYHPFCGIDWGNHTSEMDCWLETSGVVLMDLDQSNSDVSNTLTSWVSGYVSEYSIDGFRLDASKHMPLAWQSGFCKTAGIFCMGEVAGDDTAYAGTFQGPNGLDSVYGFGMMYGFVACFTGGKTMPTLAYYINAAATSYSDPTVIGSFLDNQDLPRFNSLTSDKTLVYNAIIGVFLYGGIPAIYYGLEQDISDGPADPANREALWLYNGYSTTATATYGRITAINKIRSTLGKNPAFGDSVAQVAANTDTDIALTRGGALIVLTNRGGSGTGTWVVAKSGFDASTIVMDLLSCTTLSVGSDASLTVTWGSGQPFVFVTADVASSGGFCGANTNSTTTASVSLPPSAGSSVSTSSASASTASVGGALLLSSSTESSTFSASTAGSTGNVACLSIHPLLRSGDANVHTGC